MQAMTADREMLGLEELGVGAPDPAGWAGACDPLEAAVGGEPAGCGRRAAAELLAQEAQARADRYLAMAEREARLLRASSLRRRTGWTRGALGRTVTPRGGPR